MHISLYDPISSYYEDKLNRVQNCFGNDFFPFRDFFGDQFSARFPCYLQHFGAGSCHVSCLCNILELEPLIFHIEFAAICNILELEAAVSTVFAAFLSSNLSF